MPRDQLLDTRAGGVTGGPAQTRCHAPGERFRMPNAHVRHEPEGGLPPLRGRRAEGGRHELRATGPTGDLGGGPILGKFGRTGTVKDRLLYNEGPIP